jgi:hypothetical protein
MPIDIQIRHAAMGVIYHCYDAVTIKDYFEAGNTFLATPDEIKKWRYAIIDLTSVESMDINFNEVASVVQQNNRIAANAPKGVLVAVASPNDLGYGLARMWEALVERVGWETATFRSRPEAELWILQRVKDKFGINLADSASAS